MMIEYNTDSFSDQMMFLDRHTPVGLFVNVLQQQYLVVAQSNRRIAIRLGHFTYRELGEAPVEYGAWCGEGSLRITSECCGHLPSETLNALGMIFLDGADISLTCSLPDGSIELVSIGVGDIPHDFAVQRTFDGWAFDLEGENDPFFECFADDDFPATPYDIEPQLAAPHVLQVVFDEQLE